MSITDPSEACQVSTRDVEAQDILETQERLVLSEPDFARFVELIENPGPPTQELREAMTEYHRLKVVHPEANL